VANRRRERAQALAERFGGSTISFDALDTELERADIVVASTSSPHVLIEAEELATVVARRRGRPLLLIDLAVPRDIDAACAEIPGVTLANIDDLRATVQRHLHVRRAEARQAEGIVEEEIQSFAAWLGSLEVLRRVGAGRERRPLGGPGREGPGAGRGHRPRRRAAAPPRADAPGQAGGGTRPPRAHVAAA
jgi:glutamyl-tRNA reductase